VLSVDRANAAYGITVVTIPVGTEPYRLALTPSGRKLYVANARSNSVSVVDTSTNQVIRTIADAGIEPRGIAITNGGGDDSQETVYVTQFLALPAPGKQDGADDVKTGRVTAIAAHRYSYRYDYIRCLGGKLTVPSVTYVRNNYTYKAGAEYRLESYTDRNARGASGVLAVSAAQTAQPYLHCRLRT
jgi:YVTN family beta-propeller protein